ncbi:GNAT family N-acetyltransferase [Anaerocolumna sedimenticola]|uniref:GNAT family N-acetyltransferase n=1 Tax=Anaerocolumna sedimenticola TaxID=2696063 RepID=A0A6P1TJW4_9FIRM|nr:GNAT family N-acetyltransferase [Anaerocolumna sedimenticola]QHQ60733.1 GNAT family N-acetyltransferase [Anaerocolumna sedimenticola]
MMKSDSQLIINGLNFTPVVMEDEIKKVAAAATKIWHEHFTAILSSEQIDYMVDKFQSEKAITNQIETSSYRYYMIRVEEKLIGYFAIKEEEPEKSLFLSKLYLYKEYRGYGIASKAFEFMTDLCRQKGYHKIWLTVNRYNENTIKVYEKKGFIKVRTQVADIGNGFVMDDYIMEKTI